MWKLFSQLASAVAFLHEGKTVQNPLGADGWKPVMHRDIKPENVFIRALGAKPDWSEIELKLGDFGMAEYWDPKKPNPAYACGTTCYWAPEVTGEDKNFSPASDVWGVGAILHEFAHDFMPLVDPAFTRNSWTTANPYAEQPYPSWWAAGTKRDYWAAKSPRKVVPLNPDPSADISKELDPKATATRSSRPSPRYSNELNNCIMMRCRWILKNERMLVSCWVRSMRDTPDSNSRS